MSITLELPLEEEQRLRRQAELAGRDVNDFLREIVRENTFSTFSQPSREEWEKMLDDFGDTAPFNAPLLSDYAVSRESIYGDHD